MKKHKYAEALKLNLGKICVITGHDEKDKQYDEETPAPEYYEPIEDNDQIKEPLLEADEIQHEAFNKYTSARVCVPQGDTKSHGTGVKRKKDTDGKLIGLLMLTHCLTRPSMSLSLTQERRRHTRPTILRNQSIHKSMMTDVPHMSLMRLWTIDLMGMLCSMTMRLLMKMDAR